MEPVGYFMKFLLLLASLLSFTAFGAETRIKIAVIDTGINFQGKQKPAWACQLPVKDFTGRGSRDIWGHGTNIAYIIGERINSKTHCIVVLKWLHTRNTSDEAAISQYLSALKYAFYNKIPYVNLSLSGFSANEEEQRLLAMDLALGYTIVVAAGNKNTDLGEVCNVYPTCYGFIHPNYHVVANYDQGVPAELTNYGGPVTDIARGVNVEGGGQTYTGSSQATALVTARLVNRDASQSR